MSKRVPFRQVFKKHNIMNFRGLVGPLFYFRAFFRCSNGGFTHCFEGPPFGLFSFIYNPIVVYPIYLLGSCFWLWGASYSRVWGGIFLYSFFFFESDFFLRGGGTFFWAILLVLLFNLYLFG